jgi:hypothetical protein
MAARTRAEESFAALTTRQRLRQGARLPLAQSGDSCETAKLEASAS